MGINKSKGLGIMSSLLAAGIALGACADTETQIKKAKLCIKGKVSALTAKVCDPKKQDEIINQLKGKCDLKQGLEQNFSDAELLRAALNEMCGDIIKKGE